MNEQPTTVADSLDCSWDAHSTGTDPLIDRLMALGRSTDAAAGQRVHARFLALTSQAAPIDASPIGPRPSLTVVRSRPGSMESRGRFAWSFPTAATIAVAILVVGLLTLGAYWLRTSPDSRAIRHELAALVGLDTARHDAVANAQVLLNPGNAPDGTISVVAWILTLDPGAEFSMPNGFTALGQQPIDVQLIDGEITVIASESTPTIPGPGKKWTEHLRGDILAWRNDSAKPAQLLVLGPNGATSTIGPGVTAYGIGHIDITTADGDQVNVFVDELDEANVLHRLLAGHPRTQNQSYPYRSLYVFSGSIRADDGTAYPPGSMIALNQRDGTTLLPVSSPFTAFAMGAGPWAENPTLDQQVESIAPYTLTTSLPAKGSLQAETRIITLNQGLSYALPSDGAIAYGVIGGSGTLHSSEFNSSASVTEGAIVMQRSGVTLTFTASETQPLTILQAFVGDETMLDAANRDSIPTGIVIQDAHRIPVGFGPSELTLSLRIAKGGLGGYGSNALNVIVPLGETVSISRMGGETTLYRDDGSKESGLTLGDPVPVALGDVYVVAPQADWQVNTVGTLPTIALLSIAPPDSATPASIATPGASMNRTVVSFFGNPDRCTIVPLTTGDLADLMATPSSPLPFADRSIQDASGTPADFATREEVLGMLGELVDCASTGNEANVAPFFSDEAIREQPVLRDQVAAGHGEIGVPRRAVVEDIVELPDGRVGVRFVLDLEYAYLTLVKQDGAWKIDVWDDRTADPYPDATPAP